MAKHFSSNCILTSVNATVEMVNSLLLSSFPSEIATHISTSFQHLSENEFDNSTSSAGFLNIWQKQMNNFYDAGFPLHILKLKVGAPVMLIRNIDFDQGLVNGTMLLILHVHCSATSNWLEARVISGTHKDSTVTSCRITFKHERDHKCQVSFTRKQFPVRLSFAMTIMKSQGQTFSNKVGIYLLKDLFSHCQG